MTGVVAQIAALTSHGNAFLTTGKLESFFLTNSSFQFCERVDFRIKSKKRLFSGGGVSVIAQDPDQWFLYLRNLGFELLRFRYRHSDQSDVPDYQLAGMIGGGGVWLVEAATPDHSVLWSSNWEVADIEREDKKIWRVSYSTDGQRTTRTPLDSSVSESKNDLRQALEEISQFGSDTKWRDTFAQALETLDSDAPECGYHQDLLAGDLDLERRQLFYAAAKAWVFGGMGWWNDQWFEEPVEQQRFESVTSRLYDAVNRGYEAALND